MCVCKILKQAVCRYLLSPRGSGASTMTPRGQVWVPLCACTCPPGGQVPAHRLLGGQVWAPLKLNSVHFSLCLHAPHFWRFLRHIETLLDPLGGVDTPVGRVQAPKTWVS